MGVGGWEGFPALKRWAMLGRPSGGWSGVLSSVNFGLLFSAPLALFRAPRSVDGDPFPLVALLILPVRR